MTDAGAAPSADTNAAPGGATAEVAGTAAPDSAAPDSAAPDSAAPAGTSPDSTSPGSAAPDAGAGDAPPVSAAPDTGGVAAAGAGSGSSGPMPPRLAAFVTAARGRIRSGEARPLSGTERIVLAILVLVPTLLNAIMLLPELTIPVPSLNDDMLHYLFVQAAGNALANGQSPIDFWLNNVELGVPQFLFYQHLPHLAVVALQRVSLGQLDLLTSFNLVRYALMVGLPLTVWWSMRRMGFSGAAAAIAAAVSSLLSGDFRYGFEYDSYTWRGFGLYTQLWGMHLSFITFACAYRLVQTGKGIRGTAIGFALLLLSHLIYAYMMGITLIVLFALGLRRATGADRALRLAVMGGLALAMASYMWLPFLSNALYLNASPYLLQAKYDSYGAPAILGWLFSGDLLDHDRLPVLTVLLGVGFGVAVAWGGRLVRVVAALFVFWLVIYFGRPTLGSIVDLFPFHDGLLFHRLIGAVDLMAVILIGFGGSVLWHLLAPHVSPMRLAVAGVAGAALLTPALLERAEFYRLNTGWMQRSMTAVDSDADLAAVLEKVRTLPPGRVYAGLPANFGGTMVFGDLRMYNLLYFHDIEGLPPPSESMSLNSDFIWDFHQDDEADYDLFNVRYVIAPSGTPLPPFLTTVLATCRYILYEAPTTGYATYGTVVARVPEPTQRSLFAANRNWFRGRTGPQRREFLRYDYRATVVGPGPLSMPGCGTDARYEVGGFAPGRIDVVVSCSTDATLVIKTTFHPNWQVLVDGEPTETFMVSPSFIGLALPAGRHSVTAAYRPTPVKAPLAILGLLVLLVVLLLGRRLESAVTVASARLARIVTGTRAPPVTASAGAEPQEAAPAVVGPAGAEVTDAPADPDAPAAPDAPGAAARP